MKTEIVKLINRIESEIGKTPTGELRNLLCDTNIMIHTLNKLIDTQKKTNEKKILNMNMKTGIELIAIERQEQIDKHGRTIKSDIETNKAYQLTEAAAVLSTELFRSSKKRFAAMPDDWDDEVSLKMCRKNRKERLIIAGALIAAELDKICTEEIIN